MTRKKSAASIAVDGAAAREAVIKAFASAEAFMERQIQRPAPIHGREPFMFALGLVSGIHCMVLSAGYPDGEVHEEYDSQRERFLDKYSSPSTGEQA